MFGRVSVPSPYLRSRLDSTAARPVHTVLGFQNGSRTPAVERALTDFGCEDSFGLAAERFEEHYGWVIDPSTVLRVTEGHGEAAVTFVNDCLA